MRELSIELDDDLDKRFRKVVFDRKGYRRGAIREAAIEAIQDWLKKKPGEAT